MHKQDGHEGFRAFCPDERETLSCAPAKLWRTHQSRPGKKEPREVGPPVKTISVRCEGTTSQVCVVGREESAETDHEEYRNDTFLLENRGGVPNSEDWRLRETQRLMAQ